MYSTAINNVCSGFGLHTGAFMRLEDEAYKGEVGYSYLFSDLLYNELTGNDVNFHLLAQKS
jgi:hypothetical protein